MVLSDWAAWAGIAAVPVGLISLAVQVAQGSRQRQLREKLRTNLREISTELDKATRRIKQGDELGEVPPCINDAFDNFKQFHDIRFLWSKDLYEMSEWISYVKGLWMFTAQWVKFDARDTAAGESSDLIRKRMRAEDEFIEVGNNANKEIAQLLKKLRRLDSGNFVAALFT